MPIFSLYFSFSSRCWMSVFGQMLGSYIFCVRRCLKPLGNSCCCKIEIFSANKESAVENQKQLKQNLWWVIFPQQPNWKYIYTESERDDKRKVNCGFNRLNARIHSTQNYNILYIASSLYSIFNRQLPKRAVTDKLWYCVNVCVQRDW